MSDPKRTTVYFDPEIHQALRLKSAVSERSISEMVNDAVRSSLAEDAEDLAAFENPSRIVQDSLRNQGCRTYRFRRQGGRSS
jgi:hypothetical protein